MKNLNQSRLYTEDYGWREVYYVLSDEHLGLEAVDCETGLIIAEGPTPESMLITPF